MEQERSAPSALSDVLSSCLDSQTPQGEGGLSRRAATAWFAVNGDIERAHTVCVFVRPSARRGDDPVLFVYVDSRTRALDFRVNREIYAGRLAMAGLRFSEIRFSEDRGGAARSPREGHGSPARAGSGPAPAPLPALAPEDASRIERMCAGLPESLRDSVSRAMSNSYRRSLLEGAEMVEMPSEDLSEPHEGYH